MVDFLNSKARFRKAMGDRLRWKAGGIFHPIKAFFLDGCHQPAVRDDGRRGVSVIGIDPKYVHCSGMYCGAWPVAAGVGLPASVSCKESVRQIWLATELELLNLCGDTA